MNKKLIWIEKDEESRVIRVGGSVKTQVDAINMLVSAICGIIAEAPADRQEAAKRSVCEAIMEGAEECHPVMQ